MISIAILPPQLLLWPDNSLSSDWIRMCDVCYKFERRGKFTRDSRILNSNPISLFIFTPSHLAIITNTTNEMSQTVLQL